MSHAEILSTLTHWGRVRHICVGNLTIIGSDNGSSPGRRQAIIWTTAGILLIEPAGTNFSQILIAIHIFSLQKIHLKLSSVKWQPFLLALNVLIWQRISVVPWILSLIPWYAMIGDNNIPQLIIGFHADTDTHYYLGIWPECCQPGLLIDLVCVAMLSWR